MSLDHLVPRAMNLGEPRYGTLITQDRYTGTYSGDQWLAFPPTIPGNIFDLGCWDSDSNAEEFWASDPVAEKIGRGGTPQTALEDMLRRNMAHCDAHPHARFQEGDRCPACRSEELRRLFAR